MATLPTGYSFALWKGSPLTLSGAAWKNNLLGVYKVNTNKNGLISFKPSSSFPAVTTLEQGGVYLLRVQTPFTDTDLELAAPLPQSTAPVTLNPGYAFVAYLGGGVDLGSATWKSNVSGIFKINAGRSGFLSFKPVSAFPGFATLDPAAMYLFVVSSAFSLPDAQLIVIPENMAPVVNAGIDTSIQLPTNAFLLQGNAADTDGTIAAWEWKQMNGPAPAGNLPAATQNVTVTGLVAGQYWFRLTATDDKGAASSDDVYLTVQAAPQVNPTVSTPTTSTNSVTVGTPFTAYASGSDADGTVTSVEFFLDGVSKGVATNYPAFSLSITPNTVGNNRALTAQATDNSGLKSPMSSPVLLNVTGASTAPSQVTGLTAGAVTSTSITLNWSTPADGGTAITDYKIEYSLAGAGSYGVFTDGTSATTSATVTGLAPGNTYDFRVSAINSVDTGAASALFTQGTVPNAPTGGVVDDTNNTFTFTPATY